MRILTINADLYQQNFYAKECKQNDDIQIQITALANGVSVDLSNTIMQMNYLKPDNTFVNLSNADIVITGNVVTINCPRECTRAYGLARCELVFKDSNSKQTTTFDIVITILPSVLQGQEVSKNLVTIIEQLNNWVTEHGDFKSFDERIKALESGGNLTVLTGRVKTLEDEYTNLNDDKASKSYVDEAISGIPKNETAGNFEKGQCKFIAHRGLNAAAPENTLPAYTLAGAFGFYGGETDVTTTSDGNWIVMHDDTVDRMTNGIGNVNSLALADIKNLIVDSGNNVNAYPQLRVPTLEEYLLCCKKNGLVPVVELKQTADVNKIADFSGILNKHDMTQHAMVISFSLPLLQELKKYSNVKMQYLVNNITTDNIISAGNINAGIDCEYSTITQQNILDCHLAGLEVNAWTVDDFNKCLQLINWGIDYITSNKIGGLQ